MEPREAALTVLEEERGTDHHWTVLWDLALRRGYIDPFTQPDARDAFLRALVEESRGGGRVEKSSKGTYRLRD
jgi:hypothetical protein